jgi:hypothetical protein
MEDWLKFTIGYNLIYWSDVALAADQIDTTVNLTQAGGNPLVGPARPAFAFRETDYWLQGLTLGVQISR